MCGIFGLLGPGELTPDDFERARVRGRDSWGYVCHGGTSRRALGAVPDGMSVRSDGAWCVGNTRAEPTTEWVQSEHERERMVQPFTSGRFTVAHNGTFANDRELAAEYGFEPLPVDTATWTKALDLSGASTPQDVLAFLRRTRGSYALAVGHEDGWCVLATNYRPIWTTRTSDGLKFTSSAPRGRTYLERLDEGWEMLDPYSALVSRPTDEGAELQHVSLRQPSDAPRSLVVASGGMDSTVAATLCAQKGPTDLLHITYGCRAEERELEAVHAIARRIGARVRVLDLTDVFSAIGSSRLTGTWTGAAQGVEGAEYAVEWVPARNLILLAVASGIAEGNGYTRLVLGNNIEEAGAYPDNEQEFIGRLNDAMPFAVADGRELVISEPVGALTKREIVQLGLRIGAPLDVTWSCYDGGSRHCGTCGPCFMRRTAFSMAGAQDPITYDNGPQTGL